MSTQFGHTESSYSLNLGKSYHSIHTAKFLTTERPKGEIPFLTLIVFFVFSVVFFGGKEILVFAFSPPFPRIVGVWQREKPLFFGWFALFLSKKQEKSWEFRKNSPKFAQNRWAFFFWGGRKSFPAKFPVCLGKFGV